MSSLNNNDTEKKLSRYQQKLKQRTNEILLVPPEQRRNIRYAKISALLCILKSDWEAEKRKEELRNPSSSPGRRS